MHDQQDQEHPEQNIGDIDLDSGDAAHIQGTGDQRQDKKDDGIAKHQGSPKAIDGDASIMATPAVSTHPANQRSPA
jgi:hypothetical protein